MSFSPYLINDPLLPQVLRRIVKLTEPSAAIGENSLFRCLQAQLTCCHSANALARSPQ